MNGERLEEKIEHRWGTGDRRRSQGRVFTGMALFFIGIIFLLKELNIIFFPGWLFTWPVILIVIGLLSGINHRFRGGFWIIMILAGFLFLGKQMNPAWNTNFIWPVLIMVLGLLFILRPKRGFRHRGPGSWRQRWEEPHADQQNQPPAAAETVYTDRRDFLDITAVFSGVKKNVLSKQFRGGDIVSFMGGSEIDLSQADFTGSITIEVTNIFGGTKLIVPPTWDIHSDITTIFGGVDDKRQTGVVVPDPGKVLILDGVCLFGGIEIRSF